MEPIAKKKATVSPFNKTIPNEPIEEDTSNKPQSNPIITDAVSAVVAPLPPTPNPNIIRNQGNRSVAPSPPEYVSDVMAVDRRVEGLIDYLEQWIRVGNLKMTDIRDYIQNYTA